MSQLIHKITVGNKINGQLEKMLDGLPKAEFCYTDPPWGNGNLKYWKTINEKMTGQSIGQIDQEHLEKIVVRNIVNYVQHYAFIVYGIKQADSLMQKLDLEKNVTNVQYIEKKYHNLENCVIAITLNNSPVIDWKNKLTYQNGIKGLDVVCQEFAGKYTICLDMFVGIGYYLKVLDKYGFTVYGNELNQARLDKAFKKVM